MKVKTLISGGTSWISSRAQSSFSSIFLLETDESKILMEPGYINSLLFLEEKFDEMLLKPEDITDLLISHVHLDHAFNSLFFKNAKIHVFEDFDKKDYSKFGSLMGQAYSMMVQSWKGRTEKYRDGDILFENIRVIHTPYHSKDHASFFIETENMGNIFFPGDICMTRIEYYDIIRNLRNDKVSEIVKKWTENADYIFFTHDEPYRL